jgi:uncharacterized protein involved in exopolysaccharide biosynthesis
VAVAVASFWVLRASPLYEASATVNVSAFRIAVPGFVQPPQTVLTSAEDLIGDIDTEMVAGRVAAEVRRTSSSPSPAALLAETRFTVLKPTLLRVTVTDLSPDRAAALARAWSEVIPRHIDELWRRELAGRLRLLEPRVQAARAVWLKADDAWRRAQNGPATREAASERDIARMIYETIAQQADAIRLLMAGSSGVVSLIDPAPPTGTLVRTRRTRRVVLAGILGLVAGVVAAFAVERCPRVLPS